MTNEQKARKRAEKDIKRAKLEDAMIRSLPAGYPWIVHGHALYGAVGSARLEPARSYAEDAYRPQIDDLFALSDALVPLPMVLVKDGCTSFQLQQYAEQAGKEGLEIAPFTVKIVSEKDYCRSHYIVSWHAETTVGVIRIDVHLRVGPARYFGAVNVDEKQFKHGKVCESSYRPPSYLSSISDSSGNGLAVLERQIGWWSPWDVPSDYTLYWSQLGDGATIADLVRTALQGAKL